MVVTAYQQNMLWTKGVFLLKSWRKWCDETNLPSSIIYLRGNPFRPPSWNKQSKTRWSILKCNNVKYKWGFTISSSAGWWKDFSLEPSSFRSSWKDLTKYSLFCKTWVSFLLRVCTEVAANSVRFCNSIFVTVILGQTIEFLHSVSVRSHSSAED